MEKIISEKVIKTEIVKSQNPIFKRFNNLSSSIGGLCFAPIIIIAAFGVLVYSENFGKSSEIVAKLDLEKASELTDATGMHKFEGLPTEIKPVDAPGVNDVLYFLYKQEEYKEVEKVETEQVKDVVDGEEVIKTVERTKLVEEWVETDKGSSWAPFKLGSIEIDPDGADLRLDLMKKSFSIDYFGDYVEYESGSDPQIGDNRVMVEYLPTNSEMIVVGEISRNKVSGGEAFIVSNLTDAELLENLESSENTMYWVLKVIAFFMYLAGFSAILAPLVAVADFIPFAGKLASGFAGAVGFVLALFSVIVVTLFVKFWWLLLIVGIIFVLLLMGALGYFMMNRKEKVSK